MIYTLLLYTRNEQRPSNGLRCAAEDWLPAAVSRMPLAAAAVPLLSGRCCGLRRPAARRPPAARLAGARPVGSRTTEATRREAQEPPATCARRARPA